VPEDLVDFTPELRAKAMEALKRYRVIPSAFSPPVLGDANGLLGAIISGTATNWPGGAYDPKTQTAFMPAGNTPGARTLVAPPGEFSDIRYVSGIANRPFREVLGPGDCCDAPQTAERARQARNPGSGPAPAAFPGGLPLVDGVPIVKPPYGLLAAIDLNKGEVKWQTPHGDTPDVVRNSEALKGLNIPKTGRPGRIGVLVTKTLAIAGEGGFATQPNGQRGARLIAYDKMTGTEVGSVFMPAPQTGSPMTYMVNGRQYIVLAISGGNYTGELMAFRLPGDGRSTQ
jgi:quinoprotein glucose dehydrogenase